METYTYLQMTNLLTPPDPLFSKTQKGGDLQMQYNCLTLEVTLFKTDEGGFREGRGESASLRETIIYTNINPNLN
jgi:hypothetical protein